ncbi:hypothetical protein HMPREF1577_01226 [Gardnerella pickettii JCP8017A]|uniref:Uncharacterized protein n=1 Tax=Gardnerella pickettii JCP8017A TaxID=1261062 RepID=T2PJF3_9BIFI|nr:hypothetical protein HMPREF1577_01226 [Gardnerella pickettii JCP8017A]
MQHQIADTNYKQANIKKQSQTNTKQKSHYKTQQPVLINAYI